MSDRVVGSLYVAPNGWAYRLTGSYTTYVDSEDGAPAERWVVFATSGAGSNSDGLPEGSVLVWTPPQEES